MLVVLRFTVDDPEFVGRASDALAALAACRGYQRGQLSRAYDDPAAWCLVTEWESVGAYRRALGSYEVKVRGVPVFAHAVPEASAFEVLASALPGGEIVTSASDRSDSAEVGGPGSGEPAAGGSGQIASRP